MRMLKAAGGLDAQVFVLERGYVNLETETVTFNDNQGIIRCAEDGDITITWQDSGTATVTLTTGQDFGFVGVASIAIDSGKHHAMNGKTVE